jgi:uncharacterized damage-inducible protein DinB
MSQVQAAQLAAQVKREFRRRLIGEQLPRIEQCVALLGEERIWQRPGEGSNSAGNLILHLVGNTTQWILTEFTASSDRRQRHAEFSDSGSVCAAELVKRLSDTYNKACDIVDGVTIEQMLENRTIQGYSESGLSAILHVLEHCSGHAGQIYAWTKQVTTTDLKFYDHLS